MTGDGHVLSFEGQGSTGRFTHFRWTVSGLTSDDIGDIVVVGHEANHAALNAMTVWGSLMQAIAVAARLLSDEHYIGSLTELVRRCRRTHEAYATHSSVLNVVSAHEESSAEALLAGYPAYREALADAVAVGPPGPPTLFWRRLAAEAALVACMQPDIFPLPVPLTQFRPSQLRHRDWPDSRYALLRRLAPRLWDEVDRLCAGELGPRWAEIRTADARGPGGVPGWVRELRPDIDQLCMHAAAALLNAEGRPTLSVDETMHRNSWVADWLSEALGTIRNPLVSDPQLRFGVAGLYDLERIELHPPFPAQVRPVASVDPVRLISGDAPRRHVFVSARRASVLREQFHLGDDPWGPDDPVCFVQVAPAAGQVELYPLAAPDELDRLRPVHTDRGVLANVAVSCCRDPAWRDRWLPALNRTARLTLLLDLPVTGSIDALIEADRGFRYTLARVSFDGGAQYVFGASLEGEPPLLGLCSPAAGQAFADYAFRRTGGRVVPTLDALGADLDDLSLIVGHLAQDESFIETGHFLMGRRDD